MQTTRRLRSLLSVLMSTVIGVALIGIGANPAEADPNPVEDLYRYPESPGPFEGYVTYDNAGDFTTPETCAIDQEPQRNFTVVYPGPPALGIGGDKHPVVVWGNGTSGTIGLWGGDPLGIHDSTCVYADALKHLASWGFVVIAPNDGFVGTGAELQQAIDIAEFLNNVPPTSQAPNRFYQKLDLDHLTVAGHSQGAVGAINAAAADTTDEINSVLAISAPDPAYCNPMWEAAIVALGWEFSCYQPNAVQQIDSDVPIFFVSGQTECGPDGDTQLMRDWLSAYLFFVDWELSAWVSNPVNTPCISSPASNQAFFNAKPGAAARAVSLPNASGEGAGHIDNSEALGYITTWLTYMSATPGFAPAAFCGAPPEIAGNSGWTNWQAKSLPCP